MTPGLLRRLGSLGLLLSLLLPGTCFAWVETVVKSHSARVTVERDGRAEIRHELTLKVRGGPLEEVEVAGIGAVSPLPDAVVFRAESASVSEQPLTVEPREDGSLLLKVLAENGLRGGNFVFRFAYTTSLLERAWIQLDGDRVRIAFVGPRLSTGVDTARLTFVVPHASKGPTLLPTSEGPSAGVMLHQMISGQEHDEIELLRAHLAVSEPAVWQISVDRAALAALPQGDFAGQAPVLPLVERPLIEQGFPWRHALISALLGLGFAILSFKKRRAVASLAAERRARVRPLVPIAAPSAALIAGVSFAFAAYFALEQEPTWGAVFSVVSLCLVTHLPSHPLLSPRGPGTWGKVDLDALDRTRSGAIATWLDAGTLLGFGLYCLISVGFAGWAYRLLASAPYEALLSGLIPLLLVPLFFTGRHRDQPRTPAELARAFYSVLSRRLAKGGVELEVWARQPHLSDGEWDEARLRANLPKAPHGLRALEVALEPAAGGFAEPRILIRVLEDSPARRALPGELPWMRGRSSEERVALLTPRAPTSSQTLALLLELIYWLNRAGSRSAPESTEARSSGRAALTVQPSGSSARMAM